MGSDVRSTDFLVIGGGVMGVTLALELKRRYPDCAITLRELPKFSRRHLASLAGKLVQGVDMRRFRIRGKPGIRAQPVNLRTRKLEMDFLYEGDSRSFHLLNAVSPAFTCSLPFSAYLADRIEEYIRDGRAQDTVHQADS